MYVFKVVILTFLLSPLSSALTNNLIALFDYQKIYKHLDFSQYVKGSHINLYHFKTYDINFNILEYCLNALIPRDVDAGKLYLVPLKNSGKNCESTLLSSDKVFSKEFYNIEFQEDKQSFLIKLDQYHYNIELINIKHRHSEIFSSHQKINDYGPLIVGIGKGGYRLDKLKDDSICFDVDDQCKVIQNNCNLCENSSYYVKRSNCEKRYSRVCGIRRCGKRGEYACLRGDLYKKPYCLRNSTFAFCQEDNQVDCINGELICE